MNYWKIDLQRFLVYEILKIWVSAWREKNEDGQDEKRPAPLAVSWIFRNFEERNRSRMVTFIIVCKLSELIVTGTLKLIGGIFRIAWLLMVLLFRMVSAVVSSSHCWRAANKSALASRFHFLMVGVWRFVVSRWAMKWAKTGMFFKRSNIGNL